MITKTFNKFYIVKRLIHIAMCLRVLRDALVSKVEYFRLRRSRATASERAMVRAKRQKLSKQCERYKNFENPSNFILIVHVPATPGKTKGMTSSTFAKSSNHQLTITHRFSSTYKSDARITK